VLNSAELLVHGHKSKLFQPSTIFPSWILTIEMPVIPSEPESQRILNRHQYVAAHRAASGDLVASPMVSSTVTTISGMPHETSREFLESRRAAQWLVALIRKAVGQAIRANISSIASARPWFHTSSNQRRINARSLSHPFLVHALTA